MHKKTIKILLLVLLLIVVVASVTYAWYSYKIADISGDVDDCFNIDYTSGNDLSGTIPIAYDYTGGIYTEMIAKINESCTRVYGTADIILNSLSFETTDNKELFTSAALKYVVVINNTVVSEGNITTSGERTIATNLDVARYNETEITYRIYLYIDAQLIKNSDVNSTYNGEVFMRFKMLGDETINE